MIWPSSALCLACIGVLASACRDTTGRIDPYPIKVDLSRGAVLLSAQDGDGRKFPTVIDVLSPITMVDRLELGETADLSKRFRTDLSLFDATDPVIRRLRLATSTAYNLHPCDPSPQPCRVGTDAGSTEVLGMIGADLLSRRAIRFSFLRDEVRFFPDIAGSDSERTSSCDALFTAPFSGGGLLNIGEYLVSFPGWRPTLGVCIHSEAVPEPAPDQSEQGSDIQMAISTGIGPSILSEDAYKRYAANTARTSTPGTSTATPPKLDALPKAQLQLLSGTITGKLAKIPYLALTGDIGSDSDGRGPCREVYANARMRTPGACSDPTVDCPCAAGLKTCKAAAIVELSGGTDVIVVKNSLPLLQALRDELRPQIPELDGILGTQALRSLQVDFDYPNSRILIRCDDLANCATRPQVRSQSSLSALRQCREFERQNRDAMRQDAGATP